MVLEKIDRLLVRTTCIATAVATISLIFPSVVFYGLFFLVLPALTFEFAPAAALYLLLFCSGYFLARRLYDSITLSALTGFSILFAVCAGLPAYYRGQAERALTQARANDFLPAQPIRIDQPLAIYASPSSDGTYTRCTDFCISMLYRDSIAAFIGARPDEQGYKDEVTTRYSVENYKNCLKEDVPEETRYSIWNRENEELQTSYAWLNDTFDHGRCLVGRPVNNFGDAHFVLEVAAGGSPFNGYWSMRPRVSKLSIALRVRQDGHAFRSLGRVSGVTVRRLSLWLTPVALGSFEDPSFGWRTEPIGDDESLSLPPDVSRLIAVSPESLAAFSTS